MLKKVASVSPVRWHSRLGGRDLSLRLTFPFSCAQRALPPAVRPCSRANLSAPTRCRRRIIARLNSPLHVQRFGQNRFDVNNRCAVKRLQRTYPESAPFLDFQNLDAVQADRVWAVGRPGCKDSAKGVLRVAARVEFQDIPSRFVEPSEEDQLTAQSDAVKAVRESRIKVQPRLGRSFPPLVWTVFAPLQA